MSWFVLVSTRAPVRLCAVISGLRHLEPVALLSLPSRTGWYSSNVGCYEPGVGGVEVEVEAEEQERGKIRRNWSVKP